jgi:hypothetical protein
MATWIAGILRGEATQKMADLMGIPGLVNIQKAIENGH